MIRFNTSPRPTLGVELELQLLDRETLKFRNLAPQVLAEMKPALGERIKEEFIQSMIEINTGVCEDVAEIKRDLSASLMALESTLEGLGAVFYSSSLHPFETGGSASLTDKPRYRRIMEDLQLVGRRFITQGLHVHIGVDSAERAIRINNNIRIYLPLLLALTTSSPFYGGEATGLYSYRTKLFESLPLAGLPDSLGGWDEFVGMAELLRAGGIIESVKDIWWDVRPHPDFGTVEVRICDMPYRFDEIVAMTALIQSLVVTIGNLHIHPDTRVQMQILRANKWQAARYGLDGVFVNPISARRLPMRDAIGEMLEFVEPEARRLGGLAYMGALRDVLEKMGTGAHVQKSLYAKTGDFRAMISLLREDFNK